ncbi:MAG: hypothetical protein COV29_02330 [Candidatus Yanofskybacteria bacterium CG10_big_fil_rev_8_21_14_0_10_36_16]|uniref:Pup--protein ligase n=1 Tax=Candidatus Yanofskybacteria bacterium CG10_big_fil_rev_8_21_14_0_10_36_16 TaxID=1975096 RepID=A0A2J0QAH2_9BACT|nr:MAG: hypothetical protein COV29_02330 [Candidatus Yanofskybacteria bacterium CG10_big_fil_rev_8_21_14_0_10_36_16]
MRKRICGTETEYSFYILDEDADFLDLNRHNGTKSISWKDLFDREYAKKYSCLEYFLGSSSKMFFLNGGCYHNDNGSGVSMGNSRVVGVPTPEYATPECVSARDLVLHEKAGDIIMRDLLGLEGKNKDSVAVYKHVRGLAPSEGPDSDSYDSTSGHHENYSITTEFESSLSSLFIESGAVGLNMVQKILSNFLISRIVLSGSGWFSIGNFSLNSEYPFQLSPRVRFLDRVLCQSTTSNRGLINVGRREPLIGTLSGGLGPPPFQRVHIIGGDSNMSETSIYLTAGMTMLVFKMTASGILNNMPSFQNPIDALYRFNSDPTLRIVAPLEKPNYFFGGQETTAVSMQKYFLLKAKDFAESHNLSEEEEDIIKLWEECLNMLEDDFRSLAGILDWPTQFCLTEDFLEQNGSSFDGLRIDYCERGLYPGDLVKKCVGLNLNYHAITGKGIYNKLVSEGMMTRIVNDEEIELATLVPPGDTRAWARHIFLKVVEREFPKFEILTVDWDRLIWKKRGLYYDARIELTDPFVKNYKMLYSLLERDFPETFREVIKDVA